MSIPGSPDLKVVIVPGASLPDQRWWKALHSTIITSFQNKDIMAFPPTWTRLNPDPRKGAEGLKEELGQDGVIAVVLLLDRPIACAGALPFRGPNWINDVKSADDVDTDLQVVGGQTTNTNHASDDQHVPTLPDQTALSAWDPKTDWELCCCCVHPIHRKIGLSPKILKVLVDHLKTRGVKRLVSNYVIEETGYYWPHIGFETVPGAGGVLKKGYTHTVGMEGLRADIHFAMGVKTLG